jgi:hypothetical protein
VLGYCCLLVVPLVNCDVYFYTARPILRIKKMFGYDSWICFFVVGIICSIFYQYFFKKKLKDYINFLIISAISFALAFVLYYVFLSKVRLFMLNNLIQYTPANKK